MPSPGEDIQAWSKTAAANANADPLINWAEGQPRASVNNSSRSELAAHAKDRDLKNGSITTGGPANAQIFISGVSYTSVPTGLVVKLKIGVTNTGPTTLNMDGIGDVAIKDQAGNDIGANALVLGRYVDLLYNGSNWVLLLASGSAAPFDALAYNGLQINGACEVSQERESVPLPLTSAVAAHVQDSWRAAYSSTSGNAVVAYPKYAVAPPGLANAVALQATNAAPASLAAGDYYILYQHIEGYRTGRLAWGTSGAQPVSIGFWVLTTVPTTFAVAIRNNGSARAYIVDVTTAAGGVMEYKTITIPGDTTGTWEKTNLIGLTLTFCVGAGITYKGTANIWQSGNLFVTPATTNYFATAGNAIFITGLVVLPGIDLPSASRHPFIMRPFPDELETCQRYWAKSYNYALPVNSPGTAGAIAFASSAWAATQVGGLGSGFRFPRRMRAAPTVVTYNPGGSGGGGDFVIKLAGSVSEFNVSCGLFGINEVGVQAVVSLAGVGGLTIGQVVEVAFHYTADARL